MSLLKTTIVATLWNNLSCKVKVMAQFLYILYITVNVVTCVEQKSMYSHVSTLNFDQHQFHKFFCHVKLLICKSQCSHMWVHWPKCLKISFLSKRYLISFVISYRLFVVFNNANAVSAGMWVWGFGNHAWNKSLLSSHSSATRDLTRLLYHLWFPKPHTHISYSQHLHID